MKKLVIVAVIAAVLISGGALAYQMTLGDKGPQAGDTASDSLEVVLATDKANYALGETVQLILTVKNIAADPVELTFNTSQQTEFVITAEGSDVWRWSDGMMFMQALQSKTLQPGEEAVFTAEWEQVGSDGAAISVGTYKVTGIVTSKNAVSADPVEIVVIQP